DGAVSITPFGKSLVADAGRVHIASVASAGEVTPTGAGLDVTASASGEISISDGAIIDVSGEGSGSVFIRGGKFFLGNGSQMLADARGAQDGGVTDILADEVTLQNSEIFSDATGSGKGGDITINGVESISITESRVFSDATGENSNAGNVTISTKRLTIVDGQVSSETYGKGAGGEILLRASESIDITGDGSQIIGRASGRGEDAGDAGTITIHTKSLSLTDRAKITGDTSYGGAAGGAIVIRGFEGEGHFADAVTISGDAKILSGAIDGEFAGKGEGGRIEISANRISLTDGARIDAISDGMGDAGEINLHTNSLALDNGSFVTSESASTSVHAGDAGKITVNAADSVELMGSSALTTEANGAGGGQIHVNAGNKIHLFNGEITSSVQRGEGKGGDVSTASEFVILNNGDIIANAEEGDGGAIFIVTENYLKSVDSTVSATSKRGNDGTVKIEAPDLDITSGLVALPTSLLDVTQWVETPCAARSGESVSRFVLRGWDASPSRPDDLRPFRLFWFEEPGQGDDPGEREDPGRKSPPGSWPLDHEENEKAPSDCPDGDC
ncbi:MAG: S-layer family protein, partial [Desulfobacterales bacterium]|nr:S-layer family protein [Desulfobacterales bacterium]